LQATSQQAENRTPGVTARRDSSSRFPRAAARIRQPAEAQFPRVFCLLAPPKKREHFPPFCGLNAETRPRKVRNMRRRYQRKSGRPKPRSEIPRGLRRSVELACTVFLLRRGVTECWQFRIFASPHSSHTLTSEGVLALFALRCFTLQACAKVTSTG